MKLLIVEDEHRIAQSIKKGMEQERYAVDVAYDGTKGFDLASSEEYDCIILDLMLPGMDGQAIVKTLRANGAHTPILILTAKGQTEDKVNGLTAGADDYVTKPFSFEELLARVRALMRRPKTIQNDTITVGNLTLKPHTFEVTRSGKSLSLSGKEFILLEYLMRHPNQTLTKDHIMSHVWDYDADILPNTVEVYIRNLRKKIDIPFKTQKPLIHTMRGFGYRIG